MSTSLKWEAQCSLSSSDGQSVNDESDSLQELQRKCAKAKSSHTTNKQYPGNNKKLEYEHDNDDEEFDTLIIKVQDKSTK